MRNATTSLQQSSILKVTDITDNEKPIEKTTPKFDNIFHPDLFLNNNPSFLAKLDKTLILKMKTYNCKPILKNIHL